MNSMERAVDFFVGFGFNALIILVLLSLNGKINRYKAWLSILSLITTIFVIFIPTIGFRVDKGLGIYYFGFPAEGFIYHGGWNLTFSSLGFIFNFFFFYWLYKLVQKLWNWINKVTWIKILK